MHPFRFGIQCRGPADRDGWRDLARRVEDLGWSTLTIADHFDDALAPIPALMAAADATTTLRVGSMVLGQRLPAPGRAGQGGGHPRRAHRWSLRPRHRRRLDDDRLRGGRAPARSAGSCASSGWPRRWPCCAALWSDEPCTFAGDHYRVAGLDGHPKPLTPGGPPIVIGGGGRRVLTLAGREADVVGINVNLAAGVIDRQAFWNGTPETTDEKVRWVREGAGDRDPELHVRVHLAMVTDDRDGIVEQLAGGFGLTPDQARATPHALVGDVSQICDQLVERRERWGISYLGLSADQLEPFAPVIARLAGT